MRAVGKPSTREEIGIALTQQSTQNIKDSTQSMGTTRQCRRLLGFKQRAVGNFDFHKVVEAIVKHNLGIKHHDHVDPTEHLEHFFVEIEVNGADRLRVGTLKIKDDLIFFPPHCALDSIRPHTQSVVTNIVFKKLLLFWHRVFDQFAHCALISGQQLIESRVEDIVTKAASHFNDTLLCRANCGNQSVKIAAIPVGHTAVVKDELE